MSQVQAAMPPHAKVTIDKPAGGWSRHFYDCEIARYVADRGVLPQTITLHPETMAELGYSTTWINASESERPPRRPVLVSSGDYGRDVITLYA